MSLKTNFKNVLLGVFALLLSTVSIAQNPLVYGSDTIMLIGGEDAMKAENRSVVYNFRISRALANGELPSDDIELKQLANNEIEVNLLGSLLLVLNANDSLANGDATDVLAVRLRNALSLSPSAVLETEELSQKSAVKLILQSAVFIGAILMCVLIYLFFTKLYHWARKRYLLPGGKGSLKGLKLKNFEVLSLEKQFFVFDILFKALRILLTGVFIYLTIPVAFAIFPETSHLSGQLFSYLLRPLGKLGAGLMDFIPELVNIALVLLIVSYVLRFLRYLSGEISEGKLSITNFRPEWAKPTFQLIRVLVIIIAVLILLPIFDFAQSALFLGFLSFLGIALALGSGTSVANFIAGVQIAFMRPYNIGDYIKVGDTSGEVVDSNLIVTKLKTRYNEIVSIPNVEMLKFHTVNYSASNKELGLIVYNSVYIAAEEDTDVATKLLIEAALTTKGVMENPRPFVIKRRMIDGKVELQVNAYVQEADKLYRIKSAMLDNIIVLAKFKGLTFK
jgi:small-conductance mechanosensitive channel